MKGQKHPCTAYTAPENTSHGHTCLIVAGPPTRLSASLPWTPVLPPTHLGLGIRSMTAHAYPASLSPNSMPYPPLLCLRFPEFLHLPDWIQLRANALEHLCDWLFVALVSFSWRTPSYDVSLFKFHVNLSSKCSRTLLARGRDLMLSFPLST